MAVKNYGIRDQWTNLDKLNNVDIKSVDGVIESVKINGEEAGGGGSSWQTVFDGSVTTEDEGVLSIGEIVGSDSLTADTIRVTFNNTEYICNKEEYTGEIFYGATPTGQGIDFTEYPFAIGLTPEGNLLFTETPQTVTLKVEEQSVNVKVKALTITENGEYTAPTGEAYSPVTVGVESPFKTAEVTIESVNGESVNIEMSCGILYPKSNTGDENYKAKFITGTRKTSSTFNVLLYNNEGYILNDIKGNYDLGQYYNVSSLTIEGEASQDSNKINIYGNCTLKVVWGN